MKSVYILIGPPGSGKGTQAEFLSKRLRIKSFSSGQILRQEIAAKTSLGKQADALLKRGLLMPDEVVCKMMIKRAAVALRPRLGGAQGRTGLILDGFPRNLNQAKILDEFLKSEKTRNIIIDIHLSPEIVFERILGRLSCSCGRVYHLKFRQPKKIMICNRCGRKLGRRSDDNEDTLRARLKVYERQTKPIVKYYQKEKRYRYHRINGEGSIENVYSAIAKVINELR